MKRKTFFSKVLALMLALTMVMPLIPVVHIEAADPGLVGTRSVVYNQATLYNYSDTFLKNGNKITLNQIAGKGDYNADLREIAYAQDPDAQMWEGLYFGSGNMETQTLQVPEFEVPVNMADNFSVYAHSSDDQYEQLTTNRLWNGNKTDKAWTTWTGDGDTEGYIELRANNGQSVNQIKLYFVDNEEYSFYPSTDNITISYRRNNTNTNTTVSASDIDIEEYDNYSILTVQLADYVAMGRLRVEISQTEGDYVILSEIELLGSETETINSVTKDIALYNIWPGNSPVNQIAKRAYIYSGLVKEQLINGQIQFNVPDGGLFTSDTSNKEVYNNVGVPFIYNMDSGYYEFSAGPQEYGGYGVHFDANYDGVISDEEKASGSHLVLDGNHFKAYDTVNSNYGPDTDNIAGQTHTGDGIEGFFPFNSPQQITKAADEDAYDAQAEAAVYHFGMNISVDFTMTANGTVDGTADGTPITFEFSGDDDVWVFIDGQLVLDLGGIHDSVSAKIDFKDNAITMWSTNTAYGSGDMNENSGIQGSTEAGHITQLGQILNSENGAGKITKSLKAFASEGNHTLTMFYLERGRGEANCKIRYNLPRVDTLDVTKHIQLAKGETEAITAEEWSALNAIDFTMRVLDAEQQPVTGEYALYDSSVYLGTFSTNENGYFTLKNNQTARFIGEVGTAYTVQEVATETVLPAAVWKTAQWSGTFTSVSKSGDDGGEPIVLESSISNNDTTEKTETLSYDAVVSALSPIDETIDTLSIVCTNYISRPFVSIAGETVVIDYGLPVMIDIMANDVQSSGKAFIIHNIAEAKYGTVKVMDADGKEVSSEVYTVEAGYYYLEYTPNTYLSDIEQISYTYKVQDNELDGTVVFEYLTGVATVIPATTMYYEENFKKADGSNYVLFSIADGYSKFENVDDVPKVYQEPGVVGTVNDSTYGTDKAYLEGTGDSNGTSVSVNTTSGPAAFRYTFTGTGTAFFARTSEYSGYIQVEMKDSTGKSVFISEDGTYIDYTYIDTKYAVPGKTLYNIPVFNIEGLVYDTYTVTVVIAKPAYWYSAQNQFYLDGIRVYNPIDVSDESTYAYADEVYTAYSTDLEADVQVVTLREYMLDTQTTTDTESEEKNWIDVSHITEKSQIMFTDSNGEIKTASEYESNGPKEELYMVTGQSIRFILKNWFDEKSSDARLYLGAKVPEGTEGSFTINDVYGYTIKNTTDCYYDITSSITAVEGSLDGFVEIEVNSSLISLTNLKCTGFPDFSLAGMDEVVNGPEAQTVYTLLRRSLNEEIDVPSDEITGGDTDAEPEIPEEGTDEDVEIDTPSDETDTPSDETDENVPSSNASVLVSIVKQVVSIVKNILSKLFG